MKYENFTAEELKAIEDFREIYGENLLYIAFRFKIIERLLSKNNKPHMFLQIIKNFLFSLHSQHPTAFHFEVAKHALSLQNQKEHDNNTSATLLATALLEACNKLYKKIKLPEVLTKKVNELRKHDSDKDNNPPYYLEFAEFPEENVEFEEQFFTETGLSIWDNTYIKFLISIGKSGKKEADEITKSLNLNQNKWDQNFWFKQTSDFSTSPALIILATTIWEEQVKRRARFANKEVPALTRSVNEPITKILSPQNKIIERENQLQLFHREFLLGEIQIPTINQKFLSTVLNGVRKLNTVTGHRFTRHLIGTAFERVASGHKDPRVLKLDRGASEICEQLGLIGKQHVSNVKEIVHAMAYFEFRDSNISGNLIQLSKYKSPITGREDEGYLITIGTPLIPYNTFETIRKGESGLLIPLLKDPPLVGSNRSHAGQYLLQMNIMAEISKQSRELYQDGVVELSDPLWEELAKLCGLTLDILPKIKDRWVLDGDDGPQFLIKVEQDYYTLGPDYQKVLEFLKRQGELRQTQSDRGKASRVKYFKAKQTKKSIKSEKMN